MALDQGEVLRVAAVVNCTGPVGTVGADPLLATLARRGLVRPGPAGLGVDTTDEGRVVGVLPSSSPLLAIGALRRGTLAAHALSGAGDVALLRHNDTAFLAGLGSFFGAHIAYVASFATEGRPLRDREHMAGVKAAAATFATLGPALGWAAGRSSPSCIRPAPRISGRSSPRCAS